MWLPQVLRTEWSRTESVQQILGPLKRSRKQKIIMIMNRCLFVSLILLGSHLWLAAAVRLPSVISEHMVIQRNMPDAIWGWADPGEEVTVSFRNQQKSDTAGTDGKWHITLDPMQA